MPPQLRWFSRIDVEAGAERLVGDATHVVRVARPFEAVQQRRASGASHGRGCQWQCASTRVSLRRRNSAASPAAAAGTIAGGPRCTASCDDAPSSADEECRDPSTAARGSGGRQRRRAGSNAAARSHITYGYGADRDKVRKGCPRMCHTVKHGCSRPRLPPIGWRVMIWIFERANERLRCEIHRESAGPGYELVRHPPGRIPSGWNGSRRRRRSSSARSTCRWSSSRPAGGRRCRPGPASDVHRGRLAPTVTLISTLPARLSGRAPRTPRRRSGASGPPPCRRVRPARCRLARRDGPRPTWPARRRRGSPRGPCRS